MAVLPALLRVRPGLWEWPGQAEEADPCWEPSPPEQAQISRGPSHLFPLPPAFCRAVIRLAAGGPCTVPTLRTDGGRGRLALSQGQSQRRLASELNRNSARNLQNHNSRLGRHTGGRGSVLGRARSTRKDMLSSKAHGVIMPRACLAPLIVRLRATAAAPACGFQDPGGPPHTSSSSSSLSRAWGPPPT